MANRAVSGSGQLAAALQRGGRPVPAPGVATGAISARHGKALPAMPSTAPNSPAAPPNHHLPRFFFLGGAACRSASGPFSASRSLSEVIGSSRKRMPVASNTALAMAAALGTDADSPAPSGGS